MARPELRRLPADLRLLCLGFLLTLGLAYGVALLFVFVQTEMKPAGIEEQFRGTPEDRPPAPAAGAEEEGVPSLSGEWRARSQGLRFPKPLKEMILTTHLHLLSISMILLLVGAIFACSAFPAAGKPWIIAAGFAGLVLTYACMWGVRYLDPALSAGVYLGGLLQAGSLLTQAAASLFDLARKPPAGPARA